MENKLRVLVTGASGNIGRLVTDLLVAHGATVRTFSRGHAAADHPASVEAARGDLADANAVAGAAEGMDVAFLVYPFLSVDAAAGLVEALASRVKRIVYLSTAGAGDAAERKRNPISAIHYAVEALIAEKAKEWTFVRPLGFASNTLLWSAQTRQGDVVRWPFAEARRALVHDGDIAEVAVEAILDDVLIGQTPLLTGPTNVTQRGQVDLIADATGRKLVFDESSVQDARVQMLGWGMPAPFVEGVLDYWQQCVDVPEPINDVVESILGRPARPLRDWIVANRQAFG